MKQITFPAINLNLNINSVAFRICGIEIYWYAIIIVTGIITALLICKKKDGLYNIKFDNILEMMIYTIPIAIISARLYYVIFNLKYYIDNPTQIFNLRTGGIAIYGAIIGGLITIIIYTKKHKMNLLDVLDYIVPSLVIAQSIGRWGNFVNCEAYGYETTLPWRMGIYEAGRYIEVHPTFLYESICTFIIFIILMKLSNNRKFKGQIVSIYLILYSIARSFIEGLRTDSLMAGTFRVSQILSILIFIFISILYVIQYKKIVCKKSPKI